MSAEFISRRSPVLARNGAVACSQPLASAAGLRILQAGGNAADAAVAVAAALSGALPPPLPPPPTACSRSAALTLRRRRSYRASVNGPRRRCVLPVLRRWSTGRVCAERQRAIPRETHPGARHPRLSSSAPGTSHARATRAHRNSAGRRRGLGRWVRALLHDTTCRDGRARAWSPAPADTVQRWGKLSLARVLEPAAELAEAGFPVGPVTALHWAAGASVLRAAPGGQVSRRAAAGGSPHRARRPPARPQALLLEGRAPRVGEVFRNPSLARTLRELGALGKEGFYSGRVAEAVVAAVQGAGGVMDLDDLLEHTSTFPEPISTSFRGADVIECPPNGQGLVALLALQLLERMPDLEALPHNGEEHLHRVIEVRMRTSRPGPSVFRSVVAVVRPQVLRLAFADGRRHVADPLTNPAPLAALLSPDYAERRLSQVGPQARGVLPTASWVPAPSLLLRDRLRPPVSHRPAPMRQRAAPLCPATPSTSQWSMATATARRSSIRCTKTLGPVGLGLRVGPASAPGPALPVTRPPPPGPYPACHRHRARGLWLRAPEPRRQLHAATRPRERARPAQAAVSCVASAAQHTPAGFTMAHPMRSFARHHHSRHGAAIWEARVRIRGHGTCAPCCSEPCLAPRHGVTAASLRSSLCDAPALRGPPCPFARAGLCSRRATCRCC